MIDDAPADDTRSNEELAQLVQHGRDDLWPELARRVLRMSKPIVLRKVPPVDAEDVLQDSLIRFWKALPAYSPKKGALHAYAAFLTHVQVADYWRAAGKSPDTEDIEAILNLAEEVAVNPNPSPDLSTMIEMIVGADAARAVHLRVFEGYNYAEIGEKMGKTEAAAKQQVWNALRKLRDHVGADNE